MKKILIMILLIFSIGNILSMYINHYYGDMIKVIDKDVVLDQKMYFLEKYNVKKKDKQIPIVNRKVNNLPFHNILNNKVDFTINILAIYYSDTPVAFLKYKGNKYILNNNEVITKDLKVLKIGQRYIEFEYKKVLIKKFLNKKYLEQDINNRQEKMEKVDVKDSEEIKIDKKMFNFYLKNKNKIKKEIRFSFLKGILMVSGIKTGGVFYNLGLRKGDIIEEINYEKVSKSYLVKIYSKINELNDFIILIKRKEDLIELNYSIK